jgi:hypothetical protein
VNAILLRPGFQGYECHAQSAACFCSHFKRFLFQNIIYMAFMERVFAPTYFFFADEVFFAAQSHY